MAGLARRSLGLPLGLAPLLLFVPREIWHSFEALTSSSSFALHPPPAIRADCSKASAILE